MKRKRLKIRFCVLMVAAVFAATVLTNASTVKAQGPSQMDSGDAIDPPYPSRLANNGARHKNSNFEWLGYGVDAENDSMQINVDNFDDGVFLGNLFFTPWQTTTLPFLLTVKNRNDPAHPYDSSRLLYLNVLVDWNGDGRWGGSVTGPGGQAHEWAVRNFPIDVSTWPAGVNSMMVQTPPFLTGPIPGLLWTRITLTYNQVIFAGDWDGRGIFEYGETEDYGHWMWSKPCKPWVWPWLWWPWWPLPPCCGFSAKAKPAGVQLSAANPTATFTISLTPGSTCTPTNWEVTKVGTVSGVASVTTNPPVGSSGPGMLNAITITWLNPCCFPDTKPGEIHIYLRGPCKVKHLTIRFSYNCGPFGWQMYDVGIPLIMSPGEAEDAIEVGDSISPMIAIKNYGSQPSLPGAAHLQIQDHGGQQVYEALVPLDELEPGDAVDVNFPDWTPEQEGQYFIKSYTMMPGDENPENDLLWKEVWVLGPPPMDWIADIAINEANDAIAEAEEEGRTVGLDEAREKLQDAQSTYNAGNYKDAAMLAGEAWQLAKDATKPAVPECWDKTQCHGDTDASGDVKGADFLALKASWYKCYPDPDYNECADFDRDGCVKGSDFLILKANWYQTVDPNCPQGGTWPPQPQYGDGRL